MQSSVRALEQPDVNDLSPSLTMHTMIPGCYASWKMYSAMLMLAPELHVPRLGAQPQPRAYNDTQSSAYPHGKVQTTHLPLPDGPLLPL